MKIKTSEATGVVLDWLVELAKGTHWSGNGYFVFKNADGTTRTFERNPEWRYSTDWAQGGPIIEREWISSGTSIVNEGTHHTLDNWYAKKYIVVKVQPLYGYGPTPLVAAMRCYVSSKLGDEVEVPDELA